jgi:ribonucleoside-triphosphate reductase
MGKWGGELMDITLKLTKDFERCLEDLKKKYGEDFEYINGVHPSQLDFSEFLEKFVANDTMADTTIDPNANASHKDIRSFMTEKGKSEDKLFALNKIFLEIKKKWGLRTAKQWLEQEFSKGLYLNDSSTASYFPYCWANDFTRLATEGLFFLNKYNAQPPKHLTTYFDDVIEFVSFLSNRQSGAVGMPNVLIWAYYFWKNDVKNGYYLKDPDTYLRQNFQKFIYRLNQPFLRIDQCAFTNVSIFDRPYLESLFGGVEFPDGTFAIDEIEELIKCQQVFMEVVSETREHNMFTFPVLTYSLLYKDNKFQDESFARWCSNHNMKWSDSNFFVSDNVGVLSNCCRLLSNTKKLDAFINSIGGTALSVGSCRVSTINLVRIAYESKLNKKKYIDILKDRVLLDCKALYSMRHILKRNIEKGLLPNYQEGAVELDKQFCTIGGIGMYEVMDMFNLIHTDEFGYKSYSDEAVEFATQILDTINEVKDNFDCDFSFNVEMIPAENCAGVICQADNLLYEQDKYFIYSNQWIPLTEKCTIQEKCRLGSLFDAKCGGGCIAHIDIENRFVNEDEAWDMLNYVAEHGVIYFAFTTKISVCEDRHAFIGSKNCPTCGKPVADQFARVVGFYTPVSSYQKIRKKEFNHRRWYDVLNKDGIM